MTCSLLTRLILNRIALVGNLTTGLRGPTHSGATRALSDFGATAPQEGTVSSPLLGGHEDCGH
jgi:hypothetical protein